MKLFESVSHLAGNENVIIARRYGVIETVQGKLAGIHFRPWPKIVSAPDSGWFNQHQWRRRQNDQCLLYYNQPMGHSAFLALKYTVTSLATTYATFRRALQVLDEIAKSKQSDAIVTEVFNIRISDRFLHRMGWEKHMPNSNKRNYIKRFYGNYPCQGFDPIENSVVSKG